MSEPLAIYLEDLDASDSNDRFLRCVVVGQRGQGLGCDLQGTPVWQHDAALACELIVSTDVRLLLIRHAEQTEVVVRRAGRSIRAPVGKRVILVDQDQVEVGTKRMRIHVHGEATQVHRPTPFRPRHLGAVATVAAALALSAGAAGCKKVAGWTDDGRPIDVRETPPEPTVDEHPPPPPASQDAALPAPLGSASAKPK